MRSLLVYDSSYGNTKTIAETIAQTLKESGEVDLFHVKVARKRLMSAEDYDLLLIGSPTRFGTMSFAVRGFLGAVKSEQWADKPFAAFDTENPENSKNGEGSAAEKIAARLREKGMTQASPVLKSLVLGQKGPLVHGEVERAREYARGLAVKLRAQQMSATQMQSE